MLLIPIPKPAWFDFYIIIIIIFNIVSICDFSLKLGIFTNTYAAVKKKTQKVTCIAHTGSVLFLCRPRIHTQSHTPKDSPVTVHFCPTCGHLFLLLHLCHVLSCHIRESKCQAYIYIFIYTHIYEIYIYMRQTEKVASLTWVGVGG